MTIDDDLRAELICLRNDFEACRSASCTRYDRVTSMIEAYRAEVVGLGNTAAQIASETRQELKADLRSLRDDLETLLSLLGEKGHA